MTLPDPALTPVNDLADRFWEAVLELNPTTATLYGDERYADRLEDPSATGRARARALMERTRAEAAAIGTDGLPTEDRITRDMLEVIADLQIEEDDQQLYQLRVVDQMAGPQQLLPQLTQFQPADTPERLEAFLARLHAYPAFMAANTEILREALASGLTAPRIVAERTIAQIERLLEVPIESAVIPSMVTVANEGDRERVREVVRDHVYPADRAFLEALEGDYLAATREDPGLWSAPNGDRAVPHGDPQLDDARPRSRGGPPDRARRPRIDRARASRDLAWRGFRRRHGRLSRRARCRSDEHPPDQG